MSRSADNMEWNASETIAQFSVGFSALDLSPAHYRLCARALIDTVAVAVAGRAEQASRLALRYAEQQGGVPGATAWGADVLLSIEHAALYNGIAGHVLDYDDVTSPLRGHPSIALLPPLVALAEAQDKTGEALAVAFVVGFEVLCKLARCMVADHYAKGWHSTASVGTLGATVACARLLGLSAMETRHAVGLAVAQTAGTRANFGTMAKSFQAGNAGAAALRAALLAQAGFTGAPDALGAPFGYMDLYANGEDPVATLTELGRAPLEMDTSGFEIKKYPLCYATHRAIDGVLDLKREHGIEMADVKGVEIIANNRALVPLIYPRPATGLEGKFSMHYAVVAALLDGRVSLASFQDDAVQRPAVQTRLAMVNAREDEGAQSPRWTVVRIFMNDGRVLEKRVTTLRGAANCPLTDAELIDKARDCFAFSAMAAHADGFVDAAMSLRDRKVRDIIATLGA